MSRIGPVLLLAFSFVSGVAHATVTEEHAELLLERTVGFQLETYRGMLSAMDRENEGWRTKEEFATNLEEGNALLQEARSLHAAGDDEGAVTTLGSAWSAIAPAAKSWASQASAKGKRALIRTLGSTTEDRLRLMRTYEDELPADAITAMDRAREAHAMSKTQRESDPDAALASERVAIGALNKAFKATWRDYEGEEVTDDTDDDDVAAPAARRR
ncbi:MAG: hypothetical protein H0V89_03625 [Deltaproteobacteria bacterium]|nr:hypothetical protein [Deltaproteobacteria bacterium]